MLIADLEHLESIDVKATNLRGSVGVLFLDLDSQTLSLKFDNVELFKTDLPGFVSGIVLSLQGNQIVSVSSTTTSVNGSNPQSIISIGLS